MTIQDFEAKIQAEIHPELTIRINPNASDIAGIYYQGVYMGIAVPPQEIRDEFSPSYTDKMGHPYRSVQQAYDIISGKLAKFQDPEVMKVMRGEI